MTESSPPCGALAWAGLAAADAAVAVEFCCVAFDWEASALDGYTVLRRAGEDVALVYAQTPPARAANVTTHWTPFFLVSDVGAALERVLEAGGTALRAPFDVTEGSVGPMQDPAGAPFSLWAPRADGRPSPSATGTWWMQLAASDPAASRTFYAHVLDWTSAHDSGATTILGRMNHSEGSAPPTPHRTSPCPAGPLTLQSGVRRRPSDRRFCSPAPESDDDPVAGQRQIRA